jgi:hypothetical protein
MATYSMIFAKGTLLRLGENQDGSYMAFFGA